MNEKTFLMRKIGFSEEDANFFLEEKNVGSHLYEWLLVEVVFSVWGFSPRFGLLNFSSCEENFFKKNKIFFLNLEEEKKVTYERRSWDPRDCYYDLLWVESECIPVPVFLQILGRNIQKSCLKVINFLNKYFEEVEVESPEGAVPLEVLKEDNLLKEWVEKNPFQYNLELVSEEAKDDKEFILGLLERGLDLYSLDCISQRLLGDKEVCMSIIKNNRHRYKDLPDNIRGDMDIIKLIRGESLD